MIKIGKPAIFTTRYSTRSGNHNPNTNIGPITNIPEMSDDALALAAGAATTGFRWKIKPVNLSTMLDAYERYANRDSAMKKFKP